MNKTYIIAILFVGLLLNSCGNGEVKKDEIEKGIIKELNGFDYLIKHLERNNDVINSDQAPWMMKAPALNEMIDKNILIIDVRNEADYKEGHIKHAVNVAQNNVIPYLLNDVKPSSYDKIVLVCNNGNKSAYITSMLRNLNYMNVFALKFGMSGWNVNYRDMFWGEAIENINHSFLDTSWIQMPEKGNYPEFPTCESTCAEALEKRCIDLLQKDYKQSTVNLENLMSNKADYHIISYLPEAIYRKGHLSGSVQYTPKTSLKRTAYLSTLPVDKKIAVYCFTGQHSAAVVAYLNLLGYEAYNLEYGTNGFMNDLLVENNWKPVSNKVFQNYPVVK